MQGNSLIFCVGLILVASHTMSCSSEIRPKAPVISGRTQAGGQDADQDGQGSGAGTQDPKDDSADTGKPGDPPPSTTPPPPPTPPPAAGGTLATGAVTVNFTPGLPQGGQYSPRHYLAVYVTDAQNNLVKNLMTPTGGARTIYLRRWKKIAAAQQVDGTTGATVNVAPTLRAPLVWDMKDLKGAVVPNGNYKIWFEIVTANAGDVPAGTAITALSNSFTTPDNQPGYSLLVVPITVGPAGLNKTDTSTTAFANASIVHAP